MINCYEHTKVSVQLILYLQDFTKYIFYIQTLDSIMLFILSFHSMDNWNQSYSCSRRRGKEQHKWRVFSLKEIRSATNNFYYDNKLGEGGIDSVYYWGQLWNWSQVWLHFNFYLFIYLLLQLLLFLLLLLMLLILSKYQISWSLCLLWLFFLLIFICGLWLLFPCGRARASVTFN